MVHQIDTTKKEDYLAPDTSQIRLLPNIVRRAGNWEGTPFSENKAGVCHCLLPAGRTSTPVKHKTREEAWFVLKGNGEFWLEGEQPSAIKAYSYLNIPVQRAFQFRNTSDQPLEILIITLPEWPGADEALPAKGYWD